MLAKHTEKALDRRAEFYEQAAAFPGRPRERLVAVGEADEFFFRSYPHHYRALQVVRVAAPLTRATNPSVGPLQRCEKRIVGLLRDIVLAALDSGDLVLHDPRQPDNVAFSVWALVFGTRALMNTPTVTRELCINDAFTVARETMDLLCDGLAWQPLSDRHDYQATRSRVWKEVFAADWPQSPAA
jgi:hypothetical protein